MNLAPILLSVYIRLDHTKKTIEALKKNYLSGNSHLYIFSDGPQKGDEEKVAAVREYISNISGFKKISIVQRENNNRIFNNRDGIRTLLEKYGKLIFLEEDIITAPGFLDYINNGLEEYKDRKDIFAICGYTPPINLSNFYGKDIYLSPRFSAWGVGIWKDMFEKIVMDRNEFREFLKNKKNVKEFSRNGTDLPRFLNLEAEGSLDALDVKIFYTQFKYGLYTIAPTISLTNNFGHDGTGIHCGKTDKFETYIPTHYQKLTLEKNIKINKKIAKQLYFFRSNIPLSFRERLIQKTNKIVNLKRLINKIFKFVQPKF